MSHLFSLKRKHSFNSLINSITILLLRIIESDDGLQIVRCKETRMAAQKSRFDSIDLNLIILRISLQ